MKIVASYVNEFKTKNGNAYYRFAVLNTGDTIAAKKDYSEIVPVAGKKYILDLQPRLYNDRPFISANLVCEANV